MTRMSTQLTQCGREVRLSLICQDQSAADDLFRTMHAALKYGLHVCISTTHEPSMEICFVDRYDSKNPERTPKASSMRGPKRGTTPRAHSDFPDAISPLRSEQLQEQDMIPATEHRQEQERQEV